MNKTKIIAFVVILVVLAVLALEFGNLTNVLNTGNLFPKGTTSTTSPSTSTIMSQSPLYVKNCTGIYMYENAYNGTTTYKCGWQGGNLGVWIAAGSASKVRVSIVGYNNNIYLDQLANYPCTTLLAPLDLPAQNYTVTFTTYGAGGTCTDPHEKLILNSSVSPPYTNVYDYVYDSNFSYGAYAGWIVDTNAFGQYPTNISQINNDSCFNMYNWTGLVGTYFATTASCYYPPMAGNLTSPYFTVTEPFLNFQVVSPKNTTSYIEILQNGTPEIKASFDTYAQGTGSYWYRFENVTIPISSLSGKVVQVRVVSSIVGVQPTIKTRERPLSDFIAVADIHISNTPWQQYQNITASIT